jgi:hypothetical protein
VSESTPRTPGDTPETLRDAAPIFLGHDSPRVLLAALAVAAAARIGLGGWSRWDLVPVAAIAAFWPVLEWLIHVFILHAKPIQLGRFTLDGRVPRKHRAHHRDPWNAELVFIPFHSFSYALPLVVALCFALTPTPQLALTCARRVPARRAPLRGRALPDPHARRSARRLLPPPVAQPPAPPLQERAPLVRRDAARGRSPAAHAPEATRVATSPTARSLETARG